MASITGIGTFIPSQKLTNKDLTKYLDVSEEWIVERTGILERRKSAHSETPVRMAFHASKEAIGNAGISTKEIDAIIFATVTPDFLTPSSACILQSMLGANGFAFDISAACTGFIYALFLSNALINSGYINTCLVVGSETLTRFVNYSDRNTAILFGDGCGAVIITNNSGHSLMDFHISSNSNGWKHIIIPAGGSRMPASEITVKNKIHTIKMKGREVFRNAILHMENAVHKLLEKNNLRAEDIALFIPHQANERITNALAERIGINKRRIFSNISHLGNTSSASIPLALMEIEKNKILKKGEVACLTAFGAGYTYGACLVRW